MDELFQDPSPDQKIIMQINALELKCVEYGLKFLLGKVAFDSKDACYYLTCRDAVPNEFCLYPDEIEALKGFLFRAS